MRPTEPVISHRINREITAPRVRVVGENVEPGVYTLDEALRMAAAQEVDLVEISAQADPPVVRVVDYSKFLYEVKKKQKELKSKNVKTVVKEVRFGPNTDDHDFDFKVKHARKFLEEGSKVKAFVHFKGRTIIHKDRGEVLLLKFIQALEDVGKVESMPKLEGKRMFIFINPKGKK